MAPRQRRGNSSHRVALSGVFAALAIVCMLLGGIIPIATFMAPALAGICLLPIYMEAGPKWGVLAYLAVAVLSMFFVADWELKLFFVFILGWYPLAHARLSKIPTKPVQYLLKLLIFNAAVVAVYAIMLLLLASPAFRQEFAASSLWFWLGLLAVGNFTFVVYDFLIAKLKIVYIIRFKGRFFK